MNPWVIRLIVIILAIAFLPLMVNGIATLVTEAINAAVHGIQNLLSPFSMSGHRKVEGVIRLCLYLVGVTMLVRFLMRRRK